MKKYTLLVILMCFSLLTKAQTSSGKHHIKYLEINSGNPDIGFSFLNENQVVFATSPSNKVINTDKYNPLLQFYKGEIDDNGAIINKKMIESEGLGSNKTSKSGASFSKDGKTVYFSQNKYAKRKSKKVKHELFKATVDDKGNWSNIEKVSFNKRQYSYRYPSVNKENTRLYFVSDAAPSHGGNDIFYVEIKEDGSFGEPVNLGNKVNTKGNETTPFIADNNFLYFSSDGRDDSLGNMDVYTSEVFENTVSEPLHLSSPINSLNDDYAYIVNSDNKGFFSSNRLQGRANDDIYSFYIEPEEPEECLQEIVGTVRDKDSEDLISNAVINILDDEGKVVETLKSDLTGNYKFTLSCRNTYTVTADKENYTKEEHIVNTANYYSAPPLEINQLLVKELKQVTPEKVVINVNPIYFRFDKYNISSQAAAELDKIVRIMKENPALIVESASHTDSRGPKSYNQRLSERRAKATVDYIVSKGIERSRISAKGYGESQLINKCQDGVRCSFDKHRLNRRTEFVIMNKQVLNNVPRENNAPILKKTVTSKLATLDSNKAILSKTNNKESKTYAGIEFIENYKKDESIQNNIVESDDSQDEGNIIKPESIEVEETIETEGSVLEPTDTNREQENLEENKSSSSYNDEIKETIDQPGELKKTEAINNDIDENIKESTKKKKIVEEQITRKNEIESPPIEKSIEVDFEKQDSLKPDEKVVESRKTIVIEDKPTKVSDFVVSRDNAPSEVNEKNIVLENESISYNKFNRDFTEEQSNMTNVSKKLFDESDDFDSYSGNETNSKRLVSKVATKETPKASFSSKASEIREQFMSSTKDLKKEEILSVSSIDVSPMAIRRNGKYASTSSSSNVDVMRINFQIKNNEHITPGYKEVYILIQNPEGTILNRKGKFTMNDGKELTYTEKTSAYYNNNFLNLSMITDRFIQKIIKGIYTVTIYIEGYPVGLEMFELS